MRVRGKCLVLYKPTNHILAVPVGGSLPDSYFPSWIVVVGIGG